MTTTVGWSFRSGRSSATRASTCSRQERHAAVRCGAVRLGVAGVKGFGGGFAGRCVNAFGSRSCKPSSAIPNAARTRWNSPTWSRHGRADRAHPLRRFRRRLSANSWRFTRSSVLISSPRRGLGRRGLARARPRPHRFGERVDAGRHPGAQRGPPCHPTCLQAVPRDRAIPIATAASSSVHAGDALVRQAHVDVCHLWT
jgi:hypothetical protein